MLAPFSDALSFIERGTCQKKRSERIVRDEFIRF